MSAAPAPLAARALETDEEKARREKLVNELCIAASGTFSKEQSEQLQWRAGARPQPPPIWRAPAFGSPTGPLSMIRALPGADSTFPLAGLKVELDAVAGDPTWGRVELSRADEHLQPFLEAKALGAYWLVDEALKAEAAEEGRDEPAHVGSDMPLPMRVAHVVAERTRLLMRQREAKGRALGCASGERA